MHRMYTTTLFFTLSALVAHAAPNMPPADTSIIDNPSPKVVSYAGAPADGDYPDQITDMGGFEADAPTYDPSVCPSPCFFLQRNEPGLMIGCYCRLVYYYRKPPLILR
jgi:hypothetical protein